MIKVFLDSYVRENRMLQIILLQLISDFFIPISNPISFAYRKSSFIVIAKTK